MEMSSILRDWTKDKSSIANTCRTWARYEKTEANFVS